MTAHETDVIQSYHAHVYYDAETKETAARLREAVEARFDTITMGRWHDKPVGPHPRWSYQILFEPALFGELVPWLALNRDGLTVFVHPNTDEDLPDHAEHAMWLGESLELNLSALS
jgi:DOPA 4,5-dioxygenase